MSQQQGNGPLSTFFGSSPGKQDREDSERREGDASRMSQMTKDMAVRMLHMTQFLRKKGPITVWIFSSPPPHHFCSYKDRCLLEKIPKCPVPAEKPVLSHPTESGTGAFAPVISGITFLKGDASLMTGPFLISEYTWPFWMLPFTGTMFVFLLPITFAFCFRARSSLLPVLGK